MVMDARSKVLNSNTMKYNEFASILSDQNLLNPMNLNESSSVDINFVHRPTSLPDSIHSNDEGDVHDDFDFSDLALKYINQMLMEEDIEEKNCMLHESPALQATEKSFYDALTTKDLPCNSSHSTAPYGRDLTSDVSDSTSPSIHFDSNSRFHSPVSILGFPDTFSNNPQSVVVKAEMKHEISSTSISRSRGKKNPYPHSNSENLSDEGRNSKQSAVYAEPTVRLKMFDEILLCDESKSGCLKSQLKDLNPVKPRGKKKGSGKKEVVDLRTLLTLCAQSVSTNDKIGVVNFLNQIRQHSSPIGDGMQRLAHYFSLGLEARMAGSGTGIYNSLVSKPTSAVDVLKAYHLILEILPFIKLTHFISNKTIINASKHKSKLHIIDFGIFYGFQWPSLIQRLSSRPGGPPELRITGIDFPCPGFRPSQRVEETGSRLANYAETFKVPFRFKAIAQKWETITIQDLELGDDESETVVVNCPYRFRNLLDETVISDLDSPRSKVLKLIKQINPEIFIHGIVNGTYNAPFFVTRFREALFFFSSLFDLLEANVGRDVEERRLIERTIWGREAMNVIACESGERIERPESYKQWQVRHQRLGFRQLAFDREVLEVAMERGRLGYHKDFVIGEDGGWVLQGWKGRDLYALSCWKPC